MLSRCCALLLGVLLLNSHGWAQLQRSDTARKSERGTQSATQTPVSETTAGEPTVEELLQRLDELEARTRGDAPAAQPAARSESLVMMLEHSNLATTNVYGPDGIRYFVTRLLLINLSDEPVAVETNRIVLTVDGREFTLADRPPRIESSPIQVQGQLRQYNDIKPEERLEVPPQGTAATWLLYAGLESPQVPELRLTLRTDDGEQTLNVNEYQRGMLGLGVERIGPEGCLALLTIPGELNSINAENLADELDRLAGEEVARAVIAFGETARRPDDQVLGWLVQGQANRANMQYSQLPALPVAMRELHLASLPGDDQSPWYGDGTGVVLHPSTESAAIAALRSAFEVLPREELRKETAFGHRLSRAAALAHGAARLTQDDLPLILKASREEDELIRNSALQALSQFGEAAAVERLLEAAETGSPDVRAVAVASLAGSRFPAGHLALRRYLETTTPEIRLSVIDVLAQYPRPIWSEFIYQDAYAEDPALRLAAVRGLVRIGHPELFQVLSDALASDDAALREEAFARLAERTDAKSESLANEYALQLLADAPPSGSVTSILGRTRDPRAVPLLLKHLDAVQDNRPALISLLGTVGGAEIAPELIARYKDYGDQERAAVLETLRQLGVDEARPLALEALTSKQPAVTAVAANLLASDPSEESVQLLAAALEQTVDAYAASAICNALSAVGNADARAALIKARESQDGNKRSYAISALQRIKFSSPAWQYTSQAQEPMRIAAEHQAQAEEFRAAGDEEQAEQQATLATAEFEKADEWLKLALLFDPEFAEAYSRRGHMRLTQEKLDEARSDFEQAIGLDEYDVIGVTGLAIVDAIQGEHAAAVKRIESAKERFADDMMFEYNSACVYGRALLAVQGEDESEERTAVIERYRGAGLAHLQRALELGFADRDHLRRDPDLEAFRDTPEYQEMLDSTPATEDAEAQQQQLQLKQGAVQQIEIGF